MPTSYSGTRLTLHTASYEADVVSVGAGLAALTHEGNALIHPHGDDGFAPAYMGKTLLPWPNRISGGRYRVGGSEQQLPINDVEHHAALHGLAAWTDWEVAQREENIAVLRTFIAPRPGYPWALRAKARFELSEGEGLTFTLSTTNVGEGAAPYGAAAHPYISFAGAPVDQYEIEVPAFSALEVDENLTPLGARPASELGVDFRRARVLGASQLDHAFTDLPDGQWRLRVTDIGSGRAASITSDTRWVQLYSGEEIGRRGLAVEPMTCAPDAFNNGMGLLWLEPGQTHTFRYGIKAE